MEYILNFNQKVKPHLNLPQFFLFFLLYFSFTLAISRRYYQDMTYQVQCQLLPILYNSFN